MDDTMMISLKLFKEIFVTALVGVLLGGGLSIVAGVYHLPVPAPEHRPVFFIGVVLFSVAFRLLLALREETEK